MHSGLHPDLQPTASGARANPTSPEGRGIHAAPVMSAGGAATALKIEPQPVVEVHSFLEMVTLFETRREPILAAHLINDMRLVSFAAGRIEVRPVGHMNPDIPARINRRLAEWTGTKWNLIYNEQAEGAPTIREERSAAARQARDYAFSHPKVQAVIEAFPGATPIDFIPNPKTNP
jgi:DNA polymerase-3 subunit gamma/tau